MSPEQSRRATFRVWPRVATFLGWGIGLSFLQLGAERSAALLWLTARLAEALGYGLGTLARLPIRVDGTVVSFQNWSQEVTPNCFGLAAVTFYVAAVLATPAGARARVRGIGLGLLAIMLANAARLVTLSWFFAYAWFAFGFVHIPIWGTVVPLFLVGVWGLWLVRERFLPGYPLRMLGRVALAVGPLLVAWYVVLDGYVVALVLVVNAILTAVGVPIETVRLASADLFRYLDVGLIAGGFRIEVAAQTLNVVPCVALILASSLSFARCIAVALAAVAVLMGLHVAGTAGVIVLGWMAPPVVTVFQVVNDFLSLAAGPTLWLLLSRPSREWFATVSVQPDAAIARARTEAGSAVRPAR